jgi:hypothetical protein
MAKGKTQFFECLLLYGSESQIGVDSACFPFDEPWALNGGEDESLAQTRKNWYRTRKVVFPIAK